MQCKVADNDYFGEFAAKMSTGLTLKYLPVLLSKLHYVSILEPKRRKRRKVFRVAALGTPTGHSLAMRCYLNVDFNEST
jgi:hypothetical protein